MTTTSNTPLRPPPPFEQFAGENVKRADAFAAFGAAQSEYYDALLDRDNRRCLFCAKEQAKGLAEFNWLLDVTTTRSAMKHGGAALMMSAIVSAFSGSVHALAHKLSDELSFSTRHAVCPRCFAAWKQRGRMMQGLHKLAMAAMILTAIFATMMLMFGYAESTHSRDRAEFLKWGWSCAAIAAAGAALFLFTRSRTAPQPLRHLLAGRIRAGEAKMIWRSS